MSSLFNQKLEKVFSEHKIFFCLFMVALILLGVLVSNVFSVVAFVLFAFIVIFSSDQFVICLLLFMMPFASLFKLAPETFSFFTICEIFILIKVFIKRKFSVSVLMMTILYFVYLIAGTLFRGQSDYIEHIKQAENILMLYCLVVATKKIPYEKIALHFILGMLLSSFIGIFAQNNPVFYKYTIISEGMQEYTRFCGLMGDPNYYSVNLIFALAFLLLLRKKLKVSTGMFWLLFVVFSVFGLITYSKSFILMYVIIFAIASIMVLKRMNPIENILLLCAFIGVTVAFSQGELISAFDRITTSGSMNELTTGRYGVWEQYINFILNDTGVIVFGTGLTSGLLGAHGTHNIYIEMVFHIGLAGIILLVTSFFFCLKGGREKIKRTPFNYLGWIVIAMMYFFLQALFSYVLMYNIFFAYFIFTMDFTKKEEMTPKKPAKVRYYDYDYGYGYDDDED